MLQLDPARGEAGRGRGETEPQSRWHIRRVVVATLLNNVREGQLIVMEALISLQAIHGVSSGHSACNVLQISLMTASDKLRLLMSVP